MKLTREQLLQSNYRVFLQKGEDKPRLVKFPESVDTETGVVSMWVIPLESPEELLASHSTLDNKPPEIDGFAMLKTEVGKVLLVDDSGSVVNE